MIAVMKALIGVWGIVIVITCSWFQPALARADLVLVKDGASMAPIIVMQDAPPMIRLAAEDLAAYIQKISGAKPTLLVGEPNPIPPNAIWVGFQPAVKRLFPSVDFQFNHPEEILIVANDDHLVIAGRDRWIPGKMFMQRKGMTDVIHGIQQEYGTPNAVYTFLQDHLDVRWLWPGELGEDVPRRSTISLTPFERRYHPVIRARQGLFDNQSLDRIGFRPTSDGQNWVRYQRLLLDSLAAPGGHWQATWWNRFHEAHPDYFALQPDGTRSGFPNARCAKLCVSNPAVWDQWMQEVKEELERNPNLTVFNASPNDGGDSGHCMCDQCRAWDPAEGPMLQFSYETGTREYVALTDRYLTFANILARKLKETYPGKDYYVSMSSYGNWRPTPVNVKPDDNVVISIVANFHNKKFSGRTELIEEARARFVDWSRVAPHIVWRPNLDFAMWQGGLPSVDMDAAIDDMRMVAEHHVIGIFFDKIWEHWAAHAPHYYMLTQMAWNPKADGRAILKDYYQRGFGKAAPHVEAYWQLMQQTKRNILTARESTREDPPWWKFYDKIFLAAAQKHIDDAVAAVSEEPDVYRQRIGLLQAGLDYVEAITTSRDAMVRFRGSDGEDVGAVAQARAIWIKKIRPLVISQTYPCAFNEQYLRPGGGRALQGLYPPEMVTEWPIARWLDPKP